jgi:hypothetical protein
VQLHAFCEWANAHLGSGEIHSLTDGSLDDGLILIQLVESVTGDSLGHRVARPKNPIQKLSNIAVALKYIHAHICERMNIRVRFAPEDILQRSRKNILGVTWVLIRYEAQKGLDGKDLWGSLVQWIQSTLKSCPQTDLYADITNIVGASAGGGSASSTAAAWSDGFVFLALIHSQDQDFFEWESILSMPPKERLNKAFSLAELEFGVRRLLSAEDLLGDIVVDMKTLIAYVTLLRRSFPKHALQLAAERISRWTSSLDEKKKNKQKKKMVIDDGIMDSTTNPPPSLSSSMPSCAGGDGGDGGDGDIAAILDALTDQILLADDASQHLLVMIKTLLNSMRYCCFDAKRNNPTTLSSSVVQDDDDDEEEEEEEEEDTGSLSCIGEPNLLKGEEEQAPTTSPAAPSDRCVVTEGEEEMVVVADSSEGRGEECTAGPVGTSDQRHQHTEGEEEVATETPTNLKSTTTTHTHEDEEAGSEVFSCVGVEVGTQTDYEDGGGDVHRRKEKEEKEEEKDKMDVARDEGMYEEGMDEKGWTGVCSDELHSPHAGETCADGEDSVIIKSWVEEHEEALKEFLGNHPQSGTESGGECTTGERRLYKTDAMALLSRIFVRGIEIKTGLEMELNDRPTRQQLEEIQEKVSLPT